MAELSVIFPTCNGQDLEAGLERVTHQTLQGEKGSVITDPAKAYAINIEYDRIRDALMQDRAVWERFQYIYWVRKYRSYLAVCDRLEGSLKDCFMDRMRQEYKRAMQTGQLDKSLFTTAEWRNVRSLINRSEGAASMLRTIPLTRVLAPFIPKSARRVLLDVMNRIVKRKNN